MLEELQRRNFSPTTIRSYLWASTLAKSDPLLLARNDPA
jgi:hypothetical protein